MFVSQAVKLITDMYFIQQDTGERFAIELVGPPGVGKDAAIEQAAAIIERKLGQPFHVKSFFLTTVEPPDVRGFGLPGRDSDGTAIMQFTKAPWVPKSSEPKHGFVFLNEFGQASADVAKPAAELWLNGRVGDSELPITYMVLGASNRESDRSGVGRGLAFINNRKMRVMIEPNLDSWVDWAEKSGVHPMAVAFAKFKPGVIFHDNQPPAGEPFCTPRTFCKVAHLIGKLPGELFTEAAMGYIGGAAAELVAFLRVEKELPTWEELVKNPSTVPFPADRVDVAYAAMQMVSYRVESKTAKAAFTFLARLGKEFQVAGLKSAIKRTPQLAAQAEFVSWARENRDLIIAANILDK